MSTVAECENLISIVGMGTMGRGIARAFLGSGFSVIAMDANPRLSNAAMNALTIELDRRVSRNSLSCESRDSMLSRIRIASDYSDLSDASLMVEAVFENVEVKSEVYQKAEQHLSKRCVLATNTSSLSINGLSDFVVDKSRFAGMHFFNPADVLPVVEISGSKHTSSETIERLSWIAKELGKIPIIVPDIPGFYVNRILFPMIIEAIRVLESTPEADAATIDVALKKGANLPMGPLELADFIGNDVVLSICESLLVRTQDERFRPPDLLRRAVSNGELGRKTGKGFHEYKR